MNGLSAYVDNSLYPLPFSMFGGMGDIVPLPKCFPLPYNAFNGNGGCGQPGAGSLPKAPSMPRALIGNGGNPITAGSSYAATANGSDPCGGMGNCGCASCGMGTLTSDTLIPQASLPTFLQGDAYITGVPTVYLAGALLVGAVMLMGGSSTRRRR